MQANRVLLIDDDLPTTMAEISHDDDGGDWQPCPWGDVLIFAAGAVTIALVWLIFG